jgi:diguanylate cyclase (GGDEF)-like protein
LEESTVADDAVGRPGTFDALATGAAAIARGTDVDMALGTLMGAAVAALGGASGAVSFQDPDRPQPELSLTIGLDAAEQAALVEATAKPDHPLTVAARDRTEAAAARTVALPLIAGRGGIEQGLGAIAVSWSSDHAAGDDEMTFLRAVADLAAVAVDRAQLASTVAERSEWFERVAHTDPLTGLANMRTFSRVLELELARAGRQGGEVSVAVFDIDDFTTTNEQSGRDAGDDVLRSVAAVLSGSVRLVDTVARYGGDEFILVAPGSAGMTVANRVLDGIAGLPPIGGRPVSVSAGVVRFPVDGTDAESIVAAALAAVEQARAGGKGNVGTL